MVLRFFKALFAVANLASLLAWLFSIGVGTLLTSVLTDSVELDQPWRSFFFVGALLVFLTLSVPFALMLFASLRNRVVHLNAHGMQVRQAVTAVRDELLKDKELMKRALEQRELPPPYDAAHRVVFPQVAWINNSAFLAGNPHVEKAYDLARVAYAEVEHLNQAVRGDIPVGGDHAATFRAPVRDEADAQIQAALERASDAIAALEDARGKF